MSKTPKYFMYFPGNYRWSAAFVNMLGRGAYGGADISELHKIGRLLEGKARRGRRGLVRRLRQGRRRGARARRALSTRRAIRSPPPAFYLRACHYYQMGERFRTPKDKKALDAYRTAVDCFHQFAALTDVKIEIVEVPFEGKQPARLFRARAEREVGRARRASSSSTGSTSPRKSNTSPACPT